MKSLRLFLAMLLATVLTGSVWTEPIIANNASMEKTAAYITGSFQRTQGAGYAFYLKNTQTGEEFPMSLGEEKSMLRTMPREVVAIKVPPGTYTITSWTSYDTLGKQRYTKKPIVNSPLSEPFTLSAGSVMYLGDFYMSNSGSCNGINCTRYYSINPRQISLLNAKDEFLRAYPGFIGSAFNCVLCSSKQYSIVN